MSKACVSAISSACHVRARSPSLPLTQGCRFLPAVGFTGRNRLVVVAGEGAGEGRRLRLLAAASAAVCAMVVAAGAALDDRGQDASRYAKMYTRRGMELFVEGDVEGSLGEFDKALAAFPEERPYLWQRGISLYYLNRFEDGAAQFREDIKVRPNDTEESIWCFLCEAQVYGVEESRKRMPVIGEDSRPFMRKVYELYKSGGGDPPQQMLSERRSDNGQGYFYLTLYAGLYYEAQKTEEAAKATLLSACRSSYGSRAKDYMVDVAKVHCKVRGWVP